MTKNKNKVEFKMTPERLAELRHATIVASTGASVRLSGSKVTNEEVEKILSEKETEKSDR